jgi:hypothetical protein
MLADQFLEAAAGARTEAALDELARKLWRAHAEGHLTDANVEAISEAVEARRAALAGHTTPNPPKAVLGLPRGSGPRQRREKMFGLGRPRALDRNAKVRIMHWARCLSRRTEPGKAYGVVTAKALAVLETLLWAFHNAKSGLCFPSYETIAEAAHCARSTVAEAIRALEDAGVLTWVHRIKRVRVRRGSRPSWAVKGRLSPSAARSRSTSDKNELAAWRRAGVRGSGTDGASRSSTRPAHH